MALMRTVCPLENIVSLVDKSGYFQKVLQTAKNLRNFDHKFCFIRFDQDGVYAFSLSDTSGNFGFSSDFFEDYHVAYNVTISLRISDLPPVEENEEDLSVKLTCREILYDEDFNMVPSLQLLGDVKLLLERKGKKKVLIVHSTYNDKLVSMPSLHECGGGVFTS